MESSKVLPSSILAICKDNRIALEDRARLLTKELVIFIDKLKSERAALAVDEPANMMAAIWCIINDIVTEMNTVDNVYYNYFLLKVCQYNLLFLNVKPAVGVERKDELVETSALLQRLAKLRLAPIDHPFVGSSMHTKLTYRHAPEKSPKFRDPVKAKHKDGVERFYYDDEQAAVDYQSTGDTFEAFYKKANLAIGMGTQKTNFFSLLRPVSTTQAADSFWRPRDKETQKIEKRLYRSAKAKLSQGEKLTLEEMKAYTSGEFHKGSGSSLVHKAYASGKNDLAKHFHVGHAAQEIDLGSLIIAVDPVYYNSYSTVYKRHTEAGKTTRDCIAHVICYSHNHYDHMDEQTVKEAFAGLDPLFIVPAGDALLLRKWGFKNIVEISTWNDAIEIEVADHGSVKKPKITIYPLPAKHASNREISPSMPDINLSLFMGYMFHREGADHVTLVTGDTAVLSDEDIRRLEAFLLKNNLTVSTACIAAGPDRPRSQMECTHQSSADAVTFHAKLNVINAKVLAARQSEKKETKESKPGDDISLENIYAGACRAMGYHHGCFRLGLLNHNDVEGTLMRMMATLMHYGDKATIADVLADLASHQKAIDAYEMGLESEENRRSITNFPFVAMDNFERKGLIETLKVYQSVQSMKMLPVKELVKFISMNTFLPKAGELMDFSRLSKGLEYDYSRLIVNRDNSHKDERAYEYVLRHINSTFLEILESKDDAFRHRKLVKFLFDMYQEKSSFKLNNKKGGLKGYIDGLARMKEEDVVASLAFLQGEIKGWKTADEVQRDEGHFETMILVAYGLLTDKIFRDKFVADCKKAHPELGAPRPSK